MNTSKLVGTLKGTPWARVEAGQTGISELSLQFPSERGLHGLELEKDKQGFLSSALCLQVKGDSMGWN